jgi:hypothetical protein
MGFIEKESELIGKELFVVPYYGCGWGREDGKAPPPAPIDSLRLEPFDVVVESCIQTSDEIVGIMGRIEGEKHAFANWCTACLRLTGFVNTRSDSAHCLIWLTERKPLVNADRSMAIYEWVRPDLSRLSYCGYGVLAESVAWIQELYGRVLQSRKSFAELNANN